MTAEVTEVQQPSLQTPKQRSMITYALKWAALSFAISITLAVSSSLLGFTGDDEGPFEEVPIENPADKVVMLVGIVIISPVFETLGLAAMIGLLGYITSNRAWLMVLPSAVWCAMHSILWPPWGIFVAPLFLICAYAYLDWRRVALWKALWVPMLIHAFHNTIPALIIVA
ncbi:MAG: hypothetical protein AMXMBFR84_25770 [Candidatus Hydrogenedentota bacterium]